MKKEKFEKVSGCRMERVMDLFNQLLDEDERISHYSGRLYRAKSGDKVVFGALSSVLCVKLEDLIRKIKSNSTISERD